MYVYYFTIMKFKTAVLARNKIRVYNTVNNDDILKSNKFVKTLGMNYGSKKDSLKQSKAIALWKCGYEGKGTRLSNWKIFSDFVDVRQVIKRFGIFQS